jgi:glycosyltransferase involved in cell wall biosynthesis
MNSGVSVIICCYNSASRIRDTLYYLSKQQSEPDLLWEIILVDNSSSDNTGEIAETFWKRMNSHVSLRVVYEKKPGLSVARQRGVAESNYKTIIFCDDDNHLESNYIAISNRLIHNNAEIGIVGAWVKPKLPFNPGPWIRDFYPALAIGKQADEAGFVKWIYGAGMVIKKEIFQELASKGINSMLSDRVGVKQTSGGDAEICILASFIGYKILFSPELQLHHAISPNRLSKSAFIKANFLNVYPLIFLYILDQLTQNKVNKTSRLYHKYFIERMRLMVYFFPRFLFGKHNFYSLIMLFQNIQLLFWLILKRKRFHQTVTAVYHNLYNERT